MMCGQKSALLLVLGVILSFCSWPGYGQDGWRKPLNLRIPPDVLHDGAPRMERRTIPDAPEVNMYRSQVMDRMLAIVNGRIRSNAHLCGEMDIVLLVNADGSVNDVQFPGKAVGNHSDPSGMLETVIRQALIESKSFPRAPEILSVDPKYKNYVYNSRFRRACHLSQAR